MGEAVFVEAPDVDPSPRRIAITHIFHWAGAAWLMMVSYDRAGAPMGAWLEPAENCADDLAIRAHAAGIVLSRHLQAGKTLAEMIAKTAPGRPAADDVIRALTRAVLRIWPADAPGVVMAYDCLEQRLAQGLARQ